MEARIAELRHRLEEESRRASELRDAAKAQSELAYQLQGQLSRLEMEATAASPDCLEEAKNKISSQQMQLIAKGPQNTETNVFLDNICVVLVRTTGEVNLGLISRLLTNFGVLPGRFRLVNPQCTPDSTGARRFAVGDAARSQLLSAPVFSHISEATADCRVVIGTSGVQHSNAMRLEPATLRSYLAPFLRPGATTEAKQDYLGIDAEGPSIAKLTQTSAQPLYAVVFGNEASGLSRAELLQCQAFLSLPTPGSNPSLNLSMAVALTLYELSISRDFAAPLPNSSAPSIPLASRAQVSALSKCWIETLEKLDHWGTAKNTIAKKELQDRKAAWTKAFHRMMNEISPCLSRSACNLLFGHLRSVLNKSQSANTA